MLRRRVHEMHFHSRCTSVGPGFGYYSAPRGGIGSRMQVAPATVGLRVRTGRAVMLALAGTGDAPIALVRREISLTDPKVPDSGAPFHLGLELAGARAHRAVERACHAARTAGTIALERAFHDLERDGYKLVAARVVSDSATDPETIHNAHMRAHASEGRLFRDICADAAAGHPMQVGITLSGTLRDELAHVLDPRRRAIDRMLADLGAQLGRPWQADHKLAAMAAWLALLDTGRR